MPGMMVELNKKDNETFALVRYDTYSDDPTTLETSDDWEALYKRAWEYEAHADNFESFHVTVVEKKEM